MKVKFIESSNELFKELFGLDVELTIGMVAHYSFDPEGLSYDFRKGYCQTSRINTIEYKEISLGCSNIIISTNNSTYTFQYGKPSDKKPLTKEQKDIANLMFF